jgi:hypothetical protein
MAQTEYMINHILTVLSHQYREILLYISLRFCFLLCELPLIFALSLGRELSYVKNLNEVAKSIKVCQPLKLIE